MFIFAQKNGVFKAKNNGHQNFTLSLGILDPLPLIKEIFLKIPIFFFSASYMLTLMTTKDFWTFIMFSSDPGPTIVYACQQLTN